MTDTTERTSTVAVNAGEAPPPTNAPNGDSRVLILLCLASYFAVINFVAPTPFFSTIARELETTVPLLGQLTTAMTLLSAVLGLAIGPLADRVGARRLVALGFVAVGINLLGTSLAPTYSVLLLLAVLGGLGDAALFGLPLAIAGGHFSGDAQRRAIAWTSAAMPVGAVTGVPILTAFERFLGWRGAIGLSGALVLICVWLAMAWLPADPPASSEPLRLRRLMSVYRPLLGARSMVAVYTANALRMGCWIGFLTYMGALMTDEFDLDPSRVAFGYVASGGGAVIGSFLHSGPLRRLSPQRAIAFGSAGMGLFFGVVFLGPFGAASLALVPLAAMAGGVVGVAAAVLLTRQTPVGTGTTMVFNGSVLNFGTAVGTALGGLLLAAGGYAALGLGLPVLAIAGTVVALRAPLSET